MVTLRVSCFFGLRRVFIGALPSNGLYAWKNLLNSTPSIVGRMKALTSSYFPLQARRTLS